jgi:hypothetical protein
MYEAINKGFALTTGEIMGWISATDMPHIGGLRVVGSVFRKFPEVEWITGAADALQRGRVNHQYRQCAALDADAVFGRV